ncbi:MAG: MMPL family transporter [Burkholderia sp.]|nr:MAG: hypothetical protein E5299_02012 [Burkholderia gladioli]
MLTTLLVRLVAWSIRYPILVVVLSLLSAAFSGIYTVQNFKINTDVSKLLDNEPQWAAFGKAVDDAFPQRSQMLLAVIEAPAPEFAWAAADTLAAALDKYTQVGRIGQVSLPTGSPLFERNALLFLSPAEVAKTTSKLADARPLVNMLAKDPSVTGIATTLSSTLGQPLMTGQVTLSSMKTLLSRAATSVGDVLVGCPAAFSWRALVDNNAAKRPAFAFLTVKPMVNYGALKAGEQTERTIRETTTLLQLDKRFGAVVRLTGKQPLADEEFASVEEGAVLNGIGTLIVMLIILWMALRSKRIISAVLITLLVGLAVTVALGLAMVGSLNMISVAFMVLFVGLGVDFAIQYGVRYREERHHNPNLEHALLGAAHSMGVPLSLATAAVAASFFSFLPTAYRGISELGLIAGVGMCVALLTTMILLPALLKLMHPPAEVKVPAFSCLSPVDDYLDRNRKPILIGTLVVVIGTLPLLTRLHFDCNPLHLKDPHRESMATLIALKDAPEASVNDVHMLAPTLAAANAAAARLAKLPEVGRTTTLSSFLPAEQPEKLAIIKTATDSLLPALTQQPAPPASDAQRVAALKRAAALLGYAVEDHPGPGATEAKHLSELLAKLASADLAARDRAELAFSSTLKIALGQLTSLMQPYEITRANLPPQIVNDWVAADGRALVQISPKVLPGVDPGDDVMLRYFAQAVKQAAPATIDGPISILHSADTIIKAFLQAAGLSILSITVLLWITLRRFGDVLRTLVPLLVSGVVTLELCVLLGISMNFANIIALPLMLGIGVAFKVYFVMAWRAGQTGLLHSSLTHAVLFSAATMATAFGNLWLSHHPGTASMGKLLALALSCTLIGAVVFQPVLMGKPRVPRTPPSPESDE